MTKRCFRNTLEAKKQNEQYRSIQCNTDGFTYRDFLHIYEGAKNICE